MRIASRMFLIAAVALTGARSDLDAQQPTVWVMPSSQTSVAESHQPFAELLGHQAELELSRSQVSGIRDIQQRLVRAIEPLLAQIRDAEVWGVETDEEEAALAAVQATFDDHVAAGEREAEGVLSADQLARARELLDDASLAFPGRHAEVGRSVEQNDDRAEASEPATTVRVENFNFYDANIYVISGARRQRLGFSTGLTTQSFTIPPAILLGSGEVRFEVRPIGRSGFPVTHAVGIGPGDTVVLRVPPG